MKTIIAIFFALGMFLASLVTNGQSKSDKMYNAFENKDGITNFSFSKNMIDVVDIDLDDEIDESNVTGDLKKIRFMSYNPKNGEISGSEFTKKAIAFLPKSAYKSMKMMKIMIWRSGCLAKRKNSKSVMFLLKVTMMIN